MSAKLIWVVEIRVQQYVKNQNRRVHFWPVWQYKTTSFSPQLLEWVSDSWPKFCHWGIFSPTIRADLRVQNCRTSQEVLHNQLCQFFLQNHLVLGHLCLMHLKRCVFCLGTKASERFLVFRKTHHKNFDIVVDPNLRTRGNGNVE